MQLFVRDSIDRITDAIPRLIQQRPDLIFHLLRVQYLVGGQV